MSIIETDALTEEQKVQIMNLWNKEYPAQLQYSSIEGFDSYLNNLLQPNHFLAIDDNDTLMGWAFSFTRENERWFAIIIDGSMQRQGLGTSLLNRLKENETVLNGWVTDHDRYMKKNGEQYHSPLQFYSRNNFIFCHDVRLETEKLSAVKIAWAKEG